MFQRMAPVAFLALFLIAPASLRSAEPWVDHLGEMPIGIPGSIHSRGMFHVPPNYDFVDLELTVVAKRTRALTEYRVSANSIKRDKATGYWDIKLPAERGDHEVVGVLKLKDKKTGEAIKVHTGFSDVSVPASAKK